MLFKSDTETIWYLTPYEQAIYRLNIIDFSNQFNLANQANGEITKLFSIKYDLSCYRHNVTVEGSLDEFEFFDNDYQKNDFCVRFADVKIDKLVLKKKVTLQYVVNNFSTYDEHLFKSCLYQMCPIYSCLSLDKEIFSVEHFKSKNAEFNISIPQYLNTCEEAFLIKSIGSFQSYKCLPLDVDEFWTLFILSLYTYPRVDYAYKSFINKWHFEKKIPLPDLTIYKMSPTTLVGLVEFIKLFLIFFYNSSYTPCSAVKLIRACWQKKLKINTDLLLNDNKIELVDNLSRSDNEHEIRIFPIILQNKNHYYCLYYKSNTNVDIEVEFGFNEKRIFKLDKNVFKLCFYSEPLNIRIIDDQIKVYFGNNHNKSEKISFPVDKFDKNYNNFKNFKILKFYTDDVIEFGFLKYIRKINVNANNISIRNENLYSIQSKVKTLNINNICTILGFQPAFAFLNFLNIDSWQELKHVQLNIANNTTINIVQIESKLIPIINLDNITTISKHIVKIDESKSLLFFFFPIFILFL
jgi:hypothetical protein